MVAFRTTRTRKAGYRSYKKVKDALAFLPSIAAMFSLKTTLLSLLITQAPALIMHEPAPGGAYNAIITDGLAEFTWSIEEGDPELITLNLYNSATLDTFQVGKDIPVADGAYTVQMEEVPGSEWYRMDATQHDDVREVLASSPLFTVFGDVPPTTGVVPRPTHTGKSHHHHHHHHSFKREGCHHIWKVAGIILVFGIVVAHARRIARKRREQRRVQLPLTVDDEIKEVGKN
ncbi:hypothetical protein CPB85DRAFT_132064 [Mucidula mucida]|nr:hypothetical protein CPB85DRAFT_132064 [Mucidula mucida]